MTLILVTAPPVLPVTETEVWQHLRLTLSGSPATPDDAIEALVLKHLKAAVDAIEGRDGWLGRAIIQQTWDLKLPGFPSRIRIPLPPLQSVTSVTYLDNNGNSQTLATDQYQVVGVGSFGPGRIDPAYGVTWPTTRDQAEAVTVRFVAGYDIVDSPLDYRANVPDSIKSAIKLHVEMLYDADPMARKTLRTERDDLLAKLRVW